MSRTTVTQSNRMTPEEIDEFLSGRHVARLATIGDDGAARVTPMWYLWRHHKVFLVMSTSRAQLANMRRDPRATICIDEDPRLSDGFSAGAQGVVIRGRTDVTSDPEIRDVVYREIAEVYGVAQNPEYLAARDSEERVIVVITPEKLMSWDFRKG